MKIFYNKGKNYKDFIFITIKIVDKQLKLTHQMTPAV